MNLPKIEFLKKRNKCISSVIRNTSCSSGWLRLVVQIIFGTLVVTSFVLIVIMSIGRPRRNSGPPPPCTTTSNCRVICNDVPCYGQHEDDIINAVSQVDPNCESIALKLNRPTFENSEIPQQWLSRIRFNVRELAIVGGNTRQISSSAFMTLLGTNLITLILESIEIKVWDNSMLIGLSQLRNLYIKDCFLTDVRKKAVGVVRDSLELLDIKASNSFDPINFTGSAELKALTVVDFSYNDFNNILGPSSFTRLKNCKRLFLNFCQITAIKPGTFDHLESIKELHLNDNNLITVPVALFNKLLPLEPQIDLHGNNWHCACHKMELRDVFKRGLLVVDPVCHYPDDVKGMTFSEFEVYCNGVTTKNPITSDSEENENSYEDICKMAKIIFLNTSCSEKNSSRSSELRVISSGPQKCYLNRMYNNNIEYKNIENGMYEESLTWIKPVYSVQRSPYSMIEMQSSEQPGLGLLWYHSLCSNEVFCTNTIPDVLKVFNMGKEMRYTFCPFSISNGTILNKHCVSYDFFEKSQNENNNFQKIIFYICISFGCLLCGALFVYALIHRNPTLLKGSKRVIFVKHKSIDALILPPQLPIRKEFVKEPETECSVSEKSKIFLLSNNLDKLCSSNFIRSISSKSSESNDASYISALQPTEEQLREWRSNQIVKHIDNRSASDADISPFSSIYERDSLPYYSIHTSERFYEIPKKN